MPPLAADRYAAPGATLKTPLSFAFQPYVDTALRRVVGYEALLRGPRGEPAREILAAVAEADRYAFDIDCRKDAICSGHQLGLERGAQSLNVNVLPNALGADGRWLLSTLAAAARAGFPTGKLVLEITEGERVTDPASLRAILDEFHEFGFRTAIDDLGAGWSGLHLLAELRPDYVKLDLALVERLDQDPQRQILVRELKRACDDHGCEIIAEGVEREAESRCLDDLGIFMQQGYLFAHPMQGSLVAARFPA